MTKSTAQIVPSAIAAEKDSKHCRSKESIEACCWADSVSDAQQPQSQQASIVHLLKFFSLCLAFTVYNFLIFTFWLSIFSYVLNLWPECAATHPSCIASDPVTRVHGSVGKGVFTFAAVNPVGYNTPPTLIYMSSFGRLPLVDRRGSYALLFSTLLTAALTDAVEAVARFVDYSAVYALYIVGLVNTCACAYINRDYLFKARALSKAQGSLTLLTLQHIVSNSSDAAATKVAGLSTNPPSGSSAPLLSPDIVQHNLDKEQQSLHGVAENEVCTAPDHGGDQEKSNYMAPFAPGSAPADGSSRSRKTTIRTAWMTNGLQHQAAEPATSVEHCLGVKGQGKVSPIVEEGMEASTALLSSSTTTGNVPVSTTTKGQSDSSAADGRGAEAERGEKEHKPVFASDSRPLYDKHSRKLVILIALSYVSIFITVIFFSKFIFPLQLYVGKYKSQLLDIIYGSIAIPLVTAGVVSFLRYQGYTLYYYGFVDRQDLGRNWFPTIMALTYVVAVGQRMMNLQRNSFMLTAISGIINIVGVMTVTMRDKLMRISVFQRHKISSRSMADLVGPLTNTVRAMNIMTSRSLAKLKTLSSMGSNFTVDETVGGGVPANSGLTIAQQHAALKSGGNNNGDTLKAFHHPAAQDKNSIVPSGAAQLKLDNERKDYAVQSVWIDTTISLIFSSFGSIGAANAMYLLLPVVRSPLLTPVTTGENGEAIRQRNIEIMRSGAPFQSPGWSWLCTPSQLWSFTAGISMQIAVNVVQVLVILVLLKRYCGVAIDKEYCQPRFIRRIAPMLLLFPLQLCLFFGPAGIAFMLQSELEGFALSSQADVFPACPTP